jgi:hypothetical protein
MGANPSPHHMDLTRPDRGAVLKGGAAVFGPGHLEDSPSALDPFDSEARAEAMAAVEVLDEFLHGLSEALFLISGEGLIVLPEARPSLESGQ